MSEQACCGIARETPFCPICGKRLTQNMHIGASFYSLKYKLQQTYASLQYNEKALKAEQIKFEESTKSVVEAISELKATAGEISAALDYAKEHKIGTDEEDPDNF